MDKDRTKTFIVTEYISFFMKENCLTVSNFCYKSGITIETFNKIMEGKGLSVKLKDLAQISYFMDLPLDKLIVQYDLSKYLYPFNKTFVIDD